LTTGTKPVISALAPLSEHLFPGLRVIVHGGGVPLQTRPLSAGEVAALNRPTDKRRRDHQLGRHYAHMVLTELDSPCESLLNDTDGVPCWPPSVVASLTHTQGFAAACGARDQKVLALGIDAELAHRTLPETAWRFVFSGAECSALAQMQPDARAAMALRVFSLKESAYKASCRHRRQRHLLIQIAARWNAAGQIWLDPPGLPTVQGHYARCGACLVTAVALRKPCS
jgi:4'-phosphopantetheinyl transferase EntD